MTTPEIIHPRALVDPKATLGPGVRVGAFSIIGPEVTLGAGVEIGHHVVLEGRVVLEPRVKVGHGAVIGGEPQDLKFKPGTPSGVKIGAETVIREYVTIHRATQPEGWTEIGARCLIMALSHIAHDCRVGNGVIIINYAGITGHCQIGDHATIGGYTGIVPFVRVGAYAYMGGCGKIAADLPPFMLADGTPATVRGVNVIGLRRAGIAAPDRRALQEAHRLLYRGGLSPGKALERIRAELPANPLVEQLIQFVASSRRGICPPPDGWRDSASSGDATEDAERERVI
ncbi:MAG: acyl-[acyl-carrier-protein]--UDP-N-acetylglucosamine O-acyltransferase [Candidatus Rokubacteria bacterium 13_1_40CM_69_27]|nr:MAG: acyl-[acyl-carrier-protein]--UDP-N-acetylglucosamine O-acyltransferase [Candidatus Rokubacteria bacterium 13_1_40CM_69_27]